MGCVSFVFVFFGGEVVFFGFGVFFVVFFIVEGFLDGGCVSVFDIVEVIVFVFDCVVVVIYWYIMVVN